MKKTVTKKSAFLSSIAIVVGAIATYFGYYDRIACKPNQAGFWFVIVLGFSLGAMVTLLGFWIDERKNDKKRTKGKGKNPNKS